MNNGIEIRSYKILQHLKLSILLGLIGVAAFSASSCKLGSKGPRPNILFITVDTMRWDHLGILKKNPIETPIMDNLASNGVLFERVIVSTPLTRVSHSSLFTGLYPPQHGVRDNVFMKLSPEAHTLAEYLKENGYDTGAVVSAMTVIASSGLDQGFDYYDDSMVKDYNDKDVLKINQGMADVKAARVTERALRWLRGESGKKSPWFLWAHYYDAHALYMPPHPFDILYRNDPYSGEIAYVDANIGILLAELKKMGCDKNTLVVLTSDHGEGLGEHMEQSHGFLTYDTTVRVFAVFYWPGVIPQGGRVSTQVRNIDLFATVLDILGIRKPKDNPSRSLKEFFGSKNGSGAEIKWPPAYSESLAANQSMKWYPAYSISDGRYHLIKMKDTELYDTFVDEAETNNLAQVKGEEAKRLAAMLSRMIEDFKKGPKLKTELANLSAEEREHLSALGYISESTSVMEEEPGEHAKELSLEQIMTLGRMRDTGISLLLNNEYNKARQIFLKILEINPDDTENYIKLAKICYSLGEYEEEIKYLDKYLKLASDFSKFNGLTEQGVALLAMERPLDAERVLKDAIKLNPGYAVAHLNLGMAYGRQQLYDEAEAEFRKAIELDPKYAMAYYGLGLTFGQNTHRQQAALEYLYKALEYDPNLALAHLSIGSILAQNPDLRDVDKAIYHLKKALEMEPDIEDGERAKQLLEELEKQKK